MAEFYNKYRHLFEEEMGGRGHNNGAGQNKNYLKNLFEEKQFKLDNEKIVKLARHNQKRGEFLQNTDYSKSGKILLKGKKILNKGADKFSLYKSDTQKNVNNFDNDIIGQRFQKNSNDGDFNQRRQLSAMQRNNYDRGNNLINLALNTLNTKENIYNDMKTSNNTALLAVDKKRASQDQQPMTVNIQRNVAVNPRNVQSAAVARPDDNKAELLNHKQKKLLNLYGNNLIDDYYKKFGEEQNSQPIERYQDNRGENNYLHNSKDEPFLTGAQKRKQILLNRKMKEEEELEKKKREINSYDVFSTRLAHIDAVKKRVYNENMQYNYDSQLDTKGVSYQKAIERRAIAAKNKERRNKLTQILKEENYFS